MTSPVLFQFEGVVASGRGEGRRLGYPTANIQTPRTGEFLAGVYAGWADIQARRYPSAVVIGAPGLTNCCEVHLLDFQGDLYGKRIAVSVVTKIRDMQTFSDPEELRAQIEEDIRNVRAVLNLPS